MIISYELSIGLSVLTMVVMSGAMDIQTIVEGQANGWNIFKGHIPAIMAFIIYLIAGNAEANRGPFDLAEAEQELTAGYHTEYSGMHFGFFYLAEYLNLFITAGIATTLFLGGWMPLHIAGLDGLNMVMDYIPGFVWFIGKTFFIVFLLMWIRWTFPPFAYRPGTDTGMEIPDAALAGRIVINDRMQSIWSDILIKNF